MAQNTFKTQTPKTLLPVLIRLADAGPATAADVESTSIIMGRLAARGLVKVVDQVKSGQRGRPAHIYRVTDAGRKRARRAASKAV